MARKSWDQLSASYRQRLERAGVTRESHARGASLQKARGHVSAQHERQQGRSRRRVESFIRKHSRYYGHSEDDIRDALDGLSDADRESVIRQQEAMESAYDKGNFKTASRGWNSRNPDVPEWMYWYHGTFS